MLSGGAQALIDLAADPARVDTRAGKPGGKAPSAGVAAGTRLCAVRGMACALAEQGRGRAAAAAALRAAGAEEALRQAAEGKGSSEALRSAAQAAIKAMQSALQATK